MVQNYVNFINFKLPYLRPIIGRLHSKSAIIKCFNFNNFTESLLLIIDRKFMMKWHIIILILMKCSIFNCTDCSLKCPQKDNNVEKTLINGIEHGCASKCPSFDDSFKDYELLFIEAKCVLVQTRTPGFKISWNLSKNASVSKYFLIIKKTSETLCYEFSREDKHSCETDETNDNTSPNEIIILGVSERGKAVGKGSAQPGKCPSIDIDVSVDPPHREVDVGSSVSIKCKIRGVPQPPAEKISWFFTHNTKCDKKLWKYLSRRTHVSISKDRRYVEISKVSLKDQGCYVCQANNEINEDDGKSVLSVRLRERENSYTIITMVGVACVLVSIVIVLAFVWKFRCRKNRVPLLPTGSSTEDNALESSCILYISHCSKSGDKQSRILKFADLLQRKFGVKVVMDLICHVSINNAGGMYNWVPSAMKSANKIAVILSKEYLKMLESTDKTDENVCKVHAEVKEVKQMIYEDLQRHSRIVLIYDGVDENQIPSFFKSKSYFEFPESLNSTDTVFQRIVAVLYDEEAVQLPEHLNKNESDIV